MKSTFLKVRNLVGLSLAAICLAACGGGNNESKENSSTSKEPQKVELIDNRVDAYVTVLGEMKDGKFESYDDDQTFKSLYEAIQCCIEDGEAGSYVYRKNSEEKMPMYVKQTRTDDYWFYYDDGEIADGYAPYYAGDTDWFYGEKYTRVMNSGGYCAPTYQPYMLLGHEKKTTQAWNRLPLLDAGVRYNPHAFTGIQDSTFTFELTRAKIRPSYSKIQKVIPMVNLSTTDSYNWSNQGIYMDTATGNWYYFFGETQSTDKSLEYDDEEVLMTSTWDQEKQEFTPDNDVKMTLNMVWDEDEEVTSNKITIDIMKAGKVVKTKEYTYEMNGMTMRGTHRAQIAMDLVPVDEDEDEGDYCPDFMCGAYFKDAYVTEGKGSVREGLTDDIYMGDEDMCCEAGKTYDLLAALDAVNNDTQTEVILDNYDCISYTNDEFKNDIWSISYEQKIAERDRGDAVTNAESLIEKITPDMTLDDDPAQIAYAKWEKLHTAQQFLITEVDFVTNLKVLLDAE